MTLNWNNWRELWASLPESGWPVSTAMRFLRNPPKWFVACSSAFGLFVVGRAVYLIAFGSAEEVNKYIVAVAAFVGAPFLIWRTCIADRQRHISQEELYTTLLTKAVEQLGTTREEKTEDGKVKTVSSIEVRLGAIYALEKLAGDYLPLHWQIMEILCAYVRENAGKPRPCPGEIMELYGQSLVDAQQEDALEAHQSILKAPTDVQAALTVIGRRSDRQREFELQNLKRTALLGYDRLDLRNCHLAVVNLCGLHFERADFSGACLETANMFRAFLSGAYFSRAHLEAVDLSGADLVKANFDAAFMQQAWIQDANARGASFVGALLQQSSLDGSNLRGVNFSNAIFNDVDLNGADVSGATFFLSSGLTVEQLEEAAGDRNTVLPKGMDTPKS